MKGAFVLGHQDIGCVIDNMEDFAATLRQSDAALVGNDDWTFVLGLYDPMRSLSWRPRASNEKYVLLEWSGGADGSDGFLQLVKRKEIELWPQRLRTLRIV